MKHELEALAGREVDLITKRSVEQSHNAPRRQHILTSAQVVYAAVQPLLVD
jgi:predicted nucleotidyltransferase